MTPFEQDQLLDQVRANGNWVEPMETGLTLDGHFQLADLHKLVQVLEAQQQANAAVTSVNATGVCTPERSPDGINWTLRSTTGVCTPERFEALRKHFASKLVRQCDIAKPYRDLADELHILEVQSSFLLSISKETFVELNCAIELNEFDKACEQHLAKKGLKVPPGTDFSLRRPGNPSGQFFLVVNAGNPA